MSVSIPDYSDAERELVSKLLQERYGKSLSLEAADSELRLDPASEELTLCPTLYWHQRGAHFVVCKVPNGLFRCQFFYSDADHYGTGRDSYDDLRECVLALLRVQSDHERQSAGVSSGATAANLDTEEGDEAYHGPLVV